MTKPLWLNTGYKHNSIIHIYMDTRLAKNYSDKTLPLERFCWTHACIFQYKTLHAHTNKQQKHFTRNSSHTGNMSIKRHQSTLMALVRWSWHWPGQPNRSLMRMIFFFNEELLQNYWQYCHLPATGVTDQHNVTIAHVWGRFWGICYQDITIAHMRAVPTHLQTGSNHCT